MSGYIQTWLAACGCKTIEEWDARLEAKDRAGLVGSGGGVPRDPLDQLDPSRNLESWQDVMRKELAS